VSCGVCGGELPNSITLDFKLTHDSEHSTEERRMSRKSELLPRVLFLILVNTYARLNT
jgi:hypothetical protein